MRVFINKTPNSKSFSNSREDSETHRKINRNAQVYSKAATKRKKAILPSKVAPVGWLQRLPLQPRHDGGNAALGDIQHELIQRHTASVPCKNDHGGTSTCPKCSHLNTLTLFKAPSESTTNPFSVLPVPMDAEKYSIMQYFIMRYLPAQLTFYEIADTVKENIAKGCLSSEIHFYSLLAAATARMKYVTKDRFTRPDLPEYFASQAISLMRQHLLTQKSINQQIILDMFLLATAESYSQNWDGVFMHRTAFKHGVDALGGFSQLDPSMCKMLWRGDLFVAGVTYTKPILELSWDPGPLESQSLMCVRILSGGGPPLMGAGFREELAQSTNYALLDLIEDVVGFSSSMQYFWSGFTEIPWERDWIWARSSALMHRLLSLDTNSTPGSNPDSNPETTSQYLDALIEECTRLAIVIWLYFGFFLLGRSPPQRNSLRTIVRNPIDFSLIQKRLVRIIRLGGFFSNNNLSISDSPLPLPRHMLLVLWILGLGVLATANHEEDSWLSQHFVALSKNAGIESYKEFEDRISSRYLWLQLLEETSGWQLTKLYDHARAREEYHSVPVTQHLGK